MSSFDHGYTGTLTELEKDNKFYRIYHLRSTVHNDERLLYNWGKKYNPGQFKVDMETWNLNEKKWDKINKRDYTLIKDREEITRVPDNLLEQAGINVNNLKRKWREDKLAAEAAATTPVDASHLAQFTAQLSELLNQASSSELTAEMVVTYSNLRDKLKQYQAELEDASGRMDMLTMIMKRKFGGTK